MNLLSQSGLPYFFEVGNPQAIDLRAPQARLGVGVRLWVRSLSGMQKEALVVASDSDKVWRLSSDEGPYLNGDDVAPCPLSFLTTGMVSATMNELLALAAVRGLVLRDITLVQDNFYTMEGSALRGTMTGGALPVELEMVVDSEASDAELNQLLQDAVALSPLTDLVKCQYESLFTLSHNGREIPVGRVTSLGRPPIPDPGDQFELAQVVENQLGEELIVKLAEAADAHGSEATAANKASSLSESQSRMLHVRGTCTIRPDGIKEIRQELFNPKGSIFRYLCEEAPANGGRGRAPDAMSYISAGIGFCFMTQFGRYAKIVKKDLLEYRIVQDAHFSKGGTGNPGRAEPVETHVYLTTNEDDEFARTILDMSEQTCFLHALCRSELETRVRVTRKS